VEAVDEVKMQVWRGLGQEGRRGILGGWNGANHEPKWGELSTSLSAAKRKAYSNPLRETSFNAEVEVEHLTDLKKRFVVRLGVMRKTSSGTTAVSVDDKQ
jgi:hypothetical protein